jgi:hypothetical protein
MSTVQLAILGEKALIMEPGLLKNWRPCDNQGAALAPGMS